MESIMAKPRRMDEVITNKKSYDDLVNDKYLLLLLRTYTESGKWTDPSLCAPPGGLGYLLNCRESTIIDAPDLFVIAILRRKTEAAKLSLAFCAR